MSDARRNSAYGFYVKATVGAPIPCGYLVEKPAAASADWALTLSNGWLAVGNGERYRAEDYPELVAVYERPPHRFLDVDGHEIPLPPRTFYREDEEFWFDFSSWRGRIIPAEERSPAHAYNRADRALRNRWLRLARFAVQRANAIEADDPLVNWRPWKVGRADG